MNIEDTIKDMARAARAAAGEMVRISTDQKNAALLSIAAGLEREAVFLQEENRRDLAVAEQMGLSEAMVDRLTITDATISAMVTGLNEVVALHDPVGTIGPTSIRPNGLQVARMRIPLGVIGIIYESRPNVTIDAAGLCLKAGNAVILRGGSEAIHSNRALAAVISRGLQDSGLPEKSVQVVPVVDRAAVSELLGQEEYIDLIIPRGGEGLIHFVVENSSIPVLKHYKGVCHIYVDADADLDMAQNLCFNAKVQRPGVCRLLPPVKKAQEADWSTEYLDLILSVRVVGDMDAALAHIAKYSSNHTEAIVTRDYDRARRFVREVDSSVVLVNASTRFNDGGQLGLGAEIGISAHFKRQRA